jgi:hypothetical protein
VGVLRRLSALSVWLRVASITLILVQFAVFLACWRGIAAQHVRPTNIGHDPIRQFLADAVTENRVIASNQPQITAWFCGLRSVSLPADLEELARLNRESPTPADYLFIDNNFNCIDLDVRWAELARSGPGAPQWEPLLLRDYEYALPPRMTRPLMYVVLRRRGVPASPRELETLRLMGR